MNSFNRKKAYLINLINNSQSEDDLKERLKLTLYRIFSIEDLIGRYDIIGENQDENHTKYKGTLDLSINDIGRIKALWLIGDDQLQFGSGFYKDNILVINFYYEGDDIYRGQQFKGVVVYKVLPNGVLEGFWSEKHGNQQYLGKEIAKKTKYN